MFLLSNALMSFFWDSSYWKVKRKQSQQIKCNRCIHEMVFQEHKHYFLATSFSQKNATKFYVFPLFHPRKFTYEKESNNSLPFLDILISISEYGFKISFYHKPTLSGVNSGFNSFIYDQYKIGMIFSLL